MRFSARIISGSGFARRQKVPTLNLTLEDIPEEFCEGIYACRVSLSQTSKPANLPAEQAGQQTFFSAVMHYGPRPVHNLPHSCEVHILDQIIKDPPQTIVVEVVERIRGIEDFNDSKQLQKAIQSDIVRARAILNA